MTERHDVSIEDVRLLVAERQRYDDWLAALEARRAETPSRVFERVYGDYLGRRTGVLEQLREHVETLTTVGRDLETRIIALEEQLASHEDERAEAILRTAVGEYDGDRWESVRQEVESKIGTLAEQRTGLIAEADDVRVLLASARPEPVVLESVVPDPPVSEPVVTAPTAAVAAPIAEPSPLTPELVASNVIVTEGAVLELAEPVAPTPWRVPAGYGADIMLITDNVSSHAHASNVEPSAAKQMSAPNAASSAGTPNAASQDALAEEHDGADFDDALALFSTEPRVTPTEREPLRPHTFDNATPHSADSSIDDRRVPDTANGSGARVAVGVAPQPVSAEPPPAPARDSFDDLAFLRSVIDPAAQGAGVRSSAATDQQKTLRCTECGTMNFPTEWYCERCGGELAAF